MSAFSAAERDALAKHLFTQLCTREHYDKSSGGAGWITIGGGPGPDGSKHAGGTPVKLGPGGHVEAGPKALEGKPIGDIDKDKQGDKSSPKAPAERHAEAAPPLKETATARRLADQAKVHKAMADYYRGIAGKHDPKEAARLNGLAADHDRFHGEKMAKATKPPEPARPLIEQPAAKAPEKPAEAPKPPAAKAADKSPPSQSGPKAAPPNSEDDPPFALKSPKDRPAVAKGRQSALFDKLQEPDSAEAKAMPTAAAIARGSGPHRLKNEHGEAPPPTVSADDGRWTGTATLHADDIQMDPKRFQYKVSGVGEKGVTKQLSDVKRFNPMFGGQLMVWRDPENAKTFVINGHHRVELAQRSEHYEDPTTGLKWNGEMQAFYIPAKTAEQARAWGAIANMASGHGTATDAAKFLRDTGGSIEDLQGHGVSLKGRIAQDAIQLKDLSPRAFDDVVRGAVPESRAVAVATHLKDAERQDRLLRKLADRERSGQPVSDRAAAEAAKASALAGSTTERGGGLFSDQDEEHDLVVEYGEVIESIQKSLSSERNTFRAVSSSKRSGRLSEAGNVLDTESNRQRAQSASDTLEQFNQLAHSKGGVSKAIKEAAEKLYHEPERRNEILKEFNEQLPGILDTAWRGFQAGDERYSAEVVARGFHRSSPGSSGAAADGSARAGNYDAGPVGDGAFRQQLKSAIGRAILASAIRPAIERYAAGWDESKHPRGQPENAGQFSKTAGGTATKPAPSATGAHAATSSAEYNPKSPLKSSGPLKSVDAQTLLAALAKGKNVQQSVSEAQVQHSPAVRAIEQHYPPANPNGADTLERHTGPDGKLTAQRQALHAQISAKIRAGVPASNHKTYLMMGGGPASGKSSVIHSGQVYVQQSVHIDSDAIKAELPEYQALLDAKDHRAAAYAHEESSSLAKSIQGESFAASQNVLLDGTGDNSLESVKQKADKARAAGYQVNAEYVTCSTGEALRRNMERAKKTGRMPPEGMLRATHANVSRIVPAAVEQGVFDNCRLWDTEHKDANGNPTLVMSSTGTNLVVHHPELWERFKAKANEQY